jgi:hypothetical protein
LDGDGAVRCAEILEARALLAAGADVAPSAPEDAVCRAER